MPKLKITQEVLDRLVREFKGAPIHMPPDGQLMRPGVADLLMEAPPGTAAWQPANDAAQSMFLCREACQDILYATRGFSSAPFPRVLKNLTVPLVNLLEHLVRLLNVTGAPGSVAVTGRTMWPKYDQDVFRRLARDVRRHRSGPIRRVRNKLGGHIDEDVLHGEKPVVSVEQTLTALQHCAALLLLLLNHRRVYVWIRSVGSPAPGLQVVETFFDYPAVVRWLTDADGVPLAATITYLAADPRHEFLETFRALFDAYNALAEHADCGLPTLTLNPMGGGGAGKAEAEVEHLQQVMMAYPIDISVDV